MEKDQKKQNQNVVADCVNAVEFAMFMSSVLFGRKVQKDKCYQKERKK